MGSKGGDFLTIFEDIPVEELENFITDSRLADGGAAMTAYAKMQFMEMSNLERESVVQGLLKYCELDTLAMVMIMEEWVNEVYAKINVIKYNRRHRNQHLP